MSTLKIKHFAPFFLILLFVLSFWSEITYAFEFEKNSEDISYYYLGQIFGPVGNLFNTTANDLLGKIFKVFNMAVLALGSIVVMYTVVVSTIHTAQEGEAMGKKFGSLWVPIRAVTGLAVLLPTSSGYSLIQILMTWIVLQGVWAANGIYNIILDHALSGGSVNQATKNTVEDAGLTVAANAIFKAAVCKAYLNDPAQQERVENQPITLYSDPVNASVMYLGVEGSGSYGKICGTFTSSPAMTQVVDNPTIWIDQQKKAVEDTLSNLSGVAQEAATMQSGSTPSGENIIEQTKQYLRETILATPAKPYSATTQEEQNEQNLLKQAKIDGWLYAGSYYFQLIKPPGSQRSIAFTAPLAKVPDPQPSIDSDPWSIINSKAAAYLLAAGMNTGSTGSELSLGSQDSGGIFAALASIFKPIGYAVIRGIRDADPDPLVAFASVGGTLITATEIAWFAILIASIAIILGACWGDSVFPACSVATGILTICMPIFIGLIVFLWSAGIMMALYLPLVPYLVFTFTALGWIMLVIETLVAAPIVALGIVTPAQDALGRASPAAMLITNVFLRPSLMLIGFVAASQLLIATFKMVNFSFIGSLEAAMGNIGIFGSIVVVVLYVGIMTTIVNQVFSLIYVLPDKVIRWIGGHAEASSVERAMGEAHRAAESGGKSGGELLSKSGSAIEGIGSQMAKKAKAKDKAKKAEDSKKGNAGGGAGGNAGGALMVGPGAGGGGDGDGGAPAAPPGPAPVAPPNAGGYYGRQGRPRRGPGGGADGGGNAGGGGAPDDGVQM